MNEKEERIQKQKIISIQNDLTIMNLKMNNLEIMKLKINNIEKLIKEIHEKIKNG